MCVCVFICLCVFGFIFKISMLYFKDRYTKYSEALSALRIKSLKDRREELCFKFAGDVRPRSQCLCLRDLLVPYRHVRAYPYRSQMDPMVKGPSEEVMRCGLHVLHLYVSTAPLVCMVLLLMDLSSCGTEMH